ncbi:hypothetical protein [Sphingobium sp.]|uniref:hypothetical protein n=1 Tax=Sphingobium sp. TaxID=1912891 RepID=UPI0026287746|nr:hypothetical protein [Sphingobium sp.]
MVSQARDFELEAPLITQCRALFEDVARQHQLAIEWDRTAPVELACFYRKQAGLDFELWLSLQGDEFVCGGGQWSAHIFPADAEDKWTLIVAIVNGLITGEARAVLYHPFGWRRPYWTSLQLLDNGKWKGVSTGVGCALPPIFRETIVRNGDGKNSTRLFFSWGSFSMLAIVAFAVAYFLGF